jgi:hypothetical protein
MTHALLFAAVGALNPAVLEGKTIELDRFQTPLYSESFTKGQSGGHEWFDLPRSQCLFPRRAVNVHVGNTSNGTLTLSIGNHEQKVTTTASMAWTHSLQVNTDGIQSVDLSFADKFMVDFYTEPFGKLPDTALMYVGDVYGHSASAGWTIRNGGILFKKVDFAGTVNWKRLTYLKFRQDFDALPNPTTYSVTRFYVTLKPKSLPPRPSPLP